MAYIRCAGDSGGSIQKKTATGAVATFNTGLPAPLIDVTSAIGYRSNGYTSAMVINSKTTPVIDETPYHTRLAPSNIGNMALEKLVGVSCVFNQFANITNGTSDGITRTVTNGLVELSGSSASTYAGLTYFNAIPVNHKVLIKGVIVANPNNIDFNFNLFNRVTGSHNGQTEFIDYIRPNNRAIYTVGMEGFAANTDLSGIKFYLNVIDLTALFGSSEVADYLYGLENG